MPRFAANLTMLFNEVPFLDRFEQAAKAGFKAVEFLFPYAYRAEDIKQKLDLHQLTLVLHNLPAGNWDAGDRGIACDPQRVDEFKAGVPLAIEYAKVLGVKQLNCLAGKVPAGVSLATSGSGSGSGSGSESETEKETVLRSTLVANLKFAAAAFQAEGLRLLIEPINHFDIPGFYLNQSFNFALNFKNS